MNGTSAIFSQESERIKALVWKQTGRQRQEEEMCVKIVQLSRHGRWLKLVLLDGFGRQKIKAGASLWDAFVGYLEVAC